MIEVANTLIKALFKGNTTWASWSRNILSSLILSSLFFLGFKEWSHYQMSLSNLQTLEQRIKEDPGAFSEVKRLIKDTERAYTEIQSIWLYSWPDAHNLNLVYSAGRFENPLPVGHLWTTDASDVGKLSMRICTELTSAVKNTTCAVLGNDDAWGILVVVWKDETTRPNHYKELVDALAHRIGHKLYPHQGHD